MTKPACSNYRMEAKILRCTVCGVSRTSKFALKRHLRNEHPSFTITTADPMDGSTGVSAAASSLPCTEDTRKVTLKSTRRAKQRRRSHLRARFAVDEVVRRLQSRCKRHPAYLQKSSEQMVHDLRRGTRGHKLDDVVFLAIAVTARAFAGVTRRPVRRPVPFVSRRIRLVEQPAALPTIPVEAQRQTIQQGGQPVVTPTGIVHCARRRGRRGDRSLDPVRRILFDGMTTGAVTAVSADKQQQMETLDHPDHSIPTNCSHVDEMEEDWRLCIWRSYSTQQIKRPSPMGHRWDPATIFASSSSTAPPTSPVNASHVIWGADSPEEPLDEDSVSEVPGWPLFKEHGILLRRDSPRWKERFFQWRSERTRTSPLRVDQRTPESIHFHVNRSVTAVAHPTFDDVRLPSPPSTSLAALLKLKRELGRLQYPVLPRKRRELNSGATMERPTTRSTVKRTHPPSPSSKRT